MRGRWVSAVGLCEEEGGLSGRVSQSKGKIVSLR